MGVTEEQYLALLRRNLRLLAPHHAPARVPYDARLEVPSPKPAKYHNVKVQIDGMTFDSKKEAARWQELQLMEKAGVIADLQPQPQYELHTVTPTGERAKVGIYKPDFRYTEAGQTRIEDVKANVTKTEAYRLRKRIFEAEYGLAIVEI
jgi:hypothetical protein